MGNWKGYAIVCLIALVLTMGCGKQQPAETTPEKTDGSPQGPSVELTDAQIKTLVNRSYQYVALYNINTKAAMKNAIRTNTTGWNVCVAHNDLKDHNLRSIARPSNDNLYVVCLLDLRRDPVILDVPAFDSKYASLTLTAYDHYINVPMATRLGDFKKPEKLLVYSARTEGYRGEPVEGVDRVFEASGDFVSAIFRVMPHVAEPERFQKIVAQMQSVRATSLSRFQGRAVKPIHQIVFPVVGATDMDTFGSNLLQVMQFVFNHVTFSPDDAMDQNVLEAYKPLGVVPGRAWDPSVAAQIDMARVREMAEKVKAENQAYLSDSVTYAKAAEKIMQPKGKTNLAAMVVASVNKPLGLPREEAMYPNVPTFDGAPMNAMNDYVINMEKDALPPANAFWSLTLYDGRDGYFIPNEQKKYSVGENAGMKLGKDGSIAIYIAEKKPKDVSEENWLPITRMDQNLDVILRIYNPDLEKMKSWTVPKAVKIVLE